MRKEYLKQCKVHNVLCADLKHLIKLSPKTKLSEILKMGDKEFLQKYKKATIDQKYFFEILFATVKSVCLNLITLNDFEMDCEEAVDTVLDGLNLFNKIGKFAGAGSLIPITGFANSIVSPAMEYKSEGYVMGVGGKMFTVAGPVLVFGISASIIVGIIYLIFNTQAITLV